MPRHDKYGRKAIKPLKFSLSLNGISLYIFLSIFGTIIWSLTYICLFFYKEFFLCYVKSHIKFEGKSYLLNLKEYKKYLPRIFIFNLIIIFFWIIIFFLNDIYKLYILKSGFISFIIIYITYWWFYYKNKNYEKKNFFDDYYTIINYIKNEWLNKNNNDSKKKKE